MRGLKEQKASDHCAASGHDAADLPAVVVAVHRGAIADAVAHGAGGVGIRGDRRGDTHGLSLGALLGGHGRLVPAALDHAVGADTGLEGLLPAPAAPALLTPAAIVDEPGAPGAATTPAAAVHRRAPATGRDAAGGEGGEEGDERETESERGELLHESTDAFSSHQPVRAVDHLTDG